MAVLRVLGLVLGLSLGSASAHAEELLVFAAASTTEAMQDIGKEFQAKTGNTVQFSFGGSSSLARQLLAGAPADVFISADVASMNAVEKAGLLPAKNGRRDLLGNRLVVVAPRDSTLKVSSAQDLAAVKRLSLADPAAVPAGVYAKSWLTAEKMWDALEPHVIPALDVRAALAAVEVGAADAALVYQTDALVTQRVKVLYRVPLAQTPPIRYPASWLVRSKKAAVAQAFTQFLAGPRARAIFSRRGFVVLQAESP
jgi:molybdate transport system substrate-binding protein